MSKKNCWICKYQQKGGDEFFGYCTYFEKCGKKKEPIPMKVVDVGCKFFTRMSVFKIMENMNVKPISEDEFEKIIVAEFNNGGKNESK